MNAVWRIARLALIGAAVGMYIWLGYLASASNHPPLVAVLVGVLPFMAGVIAVCWRSVWRWPALLACGAVLAAAAFKLDTLLAHASWLYFLQHVGAMVSLAIMFGGTLGTHEGALCSRVACIAIATPLAADYLHYTWKVTLAWTMYFVLCGTVSVLLFLLAPLAVWAFFAAVLTPVSLGLMFAGEFMIRLRVLPDRPHISIAQTIQSYRRFTQRKKGTA
ncbi:hypothetical protein [Leeia oryzae]|uniref:hypothetical protein n=1 Tax=Leeia oryzae TaxID=356662 RepID=UPI00035EAE74|nr:hypothetical protein [Leeia oryzae]